jgi:hypothetical protein
MSSYKRKKKEKLNLKVVCRIGENEENEKIKYLSPEKFNIIGNLLNLPSDYVLFSNFLSTLASMCISLR